MGWGPHTLVVEAKSSERAAEISSQLADLGFQPVPDPDDDYAWHPDPLAPRLIAKRENNLHELVRPHCHWHSNNAPINLLEEGALLDAGKHG